MKCINVGMVGVFIIIIIGAIIALSLIFYDGILCGMENSPSKIDIFMQDVHSMSVSQARMADSEERGK